MDYFKEIQEYYSRSGTQDLSSYEKDHQPRLDFLIEDLELDQIEGKIVCEFGAGSGYILKKMDPSNTLIAVDGYKMESTERIVRETINLDQPFAEEFLSKHGKIDAAFSFEMFEHLTNPYNFIYELKKILKEDASLYFSVPHEATQHNTYYPGLLYPVQNLIEFFSQMAFDLKLHKVHSRRFVQNVMVLSNRSWDSVRMRWPKDEDKFKGQPPHVQVNL